MGRPRMLIDQIGVPETPRKPRAGWALTHDLFEVHWTGKGSKMYADKVRVLGAVFYARRRPR